jgi:manganese transport protein
MTLSFPFTMAQNLDIPNSPSSPKSDEDTLSPRRDNAEINKPNSIISWLKTFKRFAGPGYLIAVGYLDPGNWATDLSAGSLVNEYFIIIVWL